MSRVSRSGCAWTRSVRTRSVRTRSRRTRSDRTRSGRTRSCTDKGRQDKVAWELQVKVPKLAQVEVNLKRTAKSVLYPTKTGENASGAWLGTSVACVCQIMFWLHSTVCFIVSSYQWMLIHTAGATHFPNYWSVCEQNMFHAQASPLLRPMFASAWSGMQSFTMVATVWCNITVWPFYLAFLVQTYVKLFKMSTTFPKWIGALKASAPNSHDDVPGPPCAAYTYG